MPYHYEKTNQYLVAAAQHIEQAIYTPLAPLNVTAWVTPEPVPFSERLSGTEKTIEEGESWGKLWDCAWFHFTGQVPESAKGHPVVLLIDLSGEACVVDANGCPTLGLTTMSSTYDLRLGMPGKRVVEFAQAASGGEQIDLWAD